MDPLVVSASEGARALGISRASIYTLLSSGELPSLKVAGRRLIPVEALRDFVAQRSGAEGLAERTTEPSAATHVASMIPEKLESSDRHLRPTSGQGARL